MRTQAAPPEHYGWIAERARLVIGSQFRAIEAVDDAGRVHGMVGFDGWTPNAVSMHVAVDNPLAFRKLIVPAFRIAFLEFNRGIALAMVLSTNVKSLRLVERLGFRETHRIRDGWAVGVDPVMFEMRREDCPWIGSQAKEAA